ncbi:DUF2244 domain-containing protein [Shimia ponticola]|uniref:DUF2244 domain-containing protein n=1 Tax=Shimia ponticola TaxID=2582893 RepID=UPI0011BFA04B|nr:DUF2244 domain-containing protein [Shimia ponticola]
MPYRWDDTQNETDLQLWPHRSLSKSGFKWFMGSTLLLICVPLVSVMGTVVLWGLLPFFALTIGLMWFALERNDKDRSILETLHIDPDRVELVRDNPRAAKQSWDCNTHWASLHLHPSKGPVPNYLTLRGNGREVELGAFLSEEERLELYEELQDRLTSFRTRIG